MLAIRIISVLSELTNTLLPCFLELVSLFINQTPIGAKDESPGVLVRDELFEDRIKFDCILFLILSIFFKPVSVLDYQQCWESLGLFVL